MYELKQLLYKEVKLNERKEVNLENFRLVQEKNLVYKKEFNNSDDLLSLFKMTPLYYKSSLEVLNKIKLIENLILTLGFTILVYERI
jgi:23S rRNA (guanine745-N1)-methyltransferase